MLRSSKGTTRQTDVWLRGSTCGRMERASAADRRGRPQRMAVAVGKCLHFPRLARYARYYRAPLAREASSPRCIPRPGASPVDPTKGHFVPLDPSTGCFDSGFDQREISILPLDTHRPRGSRSPLDPAAGLSVLCTTARKRRSWTMLLTRHLRVATSSAPVRQGLWTEGRCHHERAIRQREAKALDRPHCTLQRGRSAGRASDR